MFQDTEGYALLMREYSKAEDDEIGLFLGAGINLPPPGFPGTITYDTYAGFELLRAIYQHNLGHHKYQKSFSGLLSKYRKDWPVLAREVVGNLSVKKVAELLDMTLYNAMPRKDKDAQLSKKMLAQAPTLHAAICFSARIKCKNEKTGKEPTWTFIRNPRIGAVITPNYDFFFGAGWTRYHAFPKQWKVRTPFPGGESTANQIDALRKGFEYQRAINYIHGYLPYRLHEKKELVLTKASYDKFYKPDGFARRTLEEAVKNHRLIFIGTSFSDKPINEILESARGKRARHFAIEKSPSPKRLKEFDKLGIVAVPVDEYSEIADVLEEVYCRGLKSSGWRRFGLGARQYWKRLKAGPNGRPSD